MGCPFYFRSDEMAILRIRDAEGNVQEIMAIRGNDYVLTEADKREIAEMVASVMPATVSESGDEVEY